MKNIINRVVRLLITSDFFLNSGFGLIGPIFAIFIVNNIVGNNVAEAAKVAGFGALLFWIVKSLLQIPIGYYLDKNHGEIDDYWFMVIGTFMMAVVPLGYLFSTQPWHIYAVQIFYAVAAAINFPSWSAIFTRHIDEGKEAIEWGTHSTVSGIGIGIAGGLGGLVVAMFGFRSVFVFVSLFALLSGTLLLLVKKDISPINKKAIRVPLERPLP